MDAIRYTHAESALKYTKYRLVEKPKCPSFCANLGWYRRWYIDGAEARYIYVAHGPFYIMAPLSHLVSLSLSYKFHFSKPESKNVKIPATGVFVLITVFHQRWGIQLRLTNDPYRYYVRADRPHLLLFDREAKRHRRVNWAIKYMKYRLIENQTSTSLCANLGFYSTWYIHGVEHRVKYVAHGPF